MNTHQNMKNFLETSDTDRYLDMTIALSIIDENGYPDFELLINGEKQDLPKKKIMNHKKKLPLLDPIELTIKMQNKKYSQIRETALIVESISIEKINVIPDYSHLTEYENDHEQTISTNYIGYNGTWKLIIDKPFFQWIHHHSGKGILVSQFD